MRALQRSLFQRWFRDQFRGQWRPWFAALVLLAFGWALLAWNLNTFLDAREANLRSQSQRLANALQLQMTQTFAVVNSVLVSTAGRIADSRGDAAAVQRILDQSRAQLPLFLSLTYIDARGQGVASTLAGKPADSSFAERDYFKAHTQGDAGLGAGHDADLFVGAPETEPLGARQVLPLSRHVSSHGTADGRLQGVLVGAVEARYLANIFSTFIQGEHGVIILVHTTAKRFIARAPDQEKAFGFMPPQTQLFDKLRGTISGQHESKGALDGFTRIMYHHELTDLPLAILVGFAREDLHQDYANVVRDHVLGAALWLALLVILTFSYLHLQRRRQRDAEKYRTIADFTYAWELWIAPDGRFLYVSPACLQLTGYPPEEFIADPSLLQALVHPHDRARLVDCLANLRDVGELQFRLIDATGVERWVEFTARAVTDQDKPKDKHLGWRASIRDTTARKRAEDALRDTQLQLEQRVHERTADLELARREADSANRAKSDFLANMSHEIRTPINAIMGMTRQALRAEPPPEITHCLNKVTRASTHLLRVIDDILDFSIIEAGRLQLKPGEFSLVELFDDLDSMFADQARSKGLELHFDIAPALQRPVLGDRMRIGQVLMNFISNALKFTDLGAISVSASVTKTAPPGDHAPRLRVRFDVSDTGIGIPDENRQRLFDAFQQADTSATRKFGGSGLGLTLCARLAQLMGGTVGFDSAPGAGSTFWFELELDYVVPPSRPAAAEVATVTTMVTEKPTPVPANPQPLRGVRVLLVEDDLTNQLVAEDILSEAGAQTTIANNGADALACLHREGFSAWDIVITDIQMPVMDGHALARAILERAPTLPIIACTAHAFAEERRLCLANGMREHVSKPVAPDALIAAILRHLPPAPLP